LEWCSRIVAVGDAVFEADASGDRVCDTAEDAINQTVAGGDGESETVAIGDGVGKPFAVGNRVAASVKFGKALTIDCDRNSS
jgi:hypothetical protein